MSEHAVLIVTNEIDAHADYMVEYLTGRGVPVIRLHPDEFGLYYDSDITIHSSGHSMRLQDRLTARHIDLSAVRSVWWRRPMRHRLPSHIVDHEAVFARSELGEFTYGIWGLLGEQFWLDRPHLVRSAGFKLEQMRRAAQLGFRVPRSLVTTRAESVRAFAVDCPSGVIYKTLNTPALSSNTAGAAGQAGGDWDLEVRTTLLESAHFELLEGVSIVPSLFQEYIPKAYELRVTVVGHQVFAAAIDSQTRPETRVDWRDYSVDIPYRAAQLPQAIADRCLALVHSYGLNYSALDLIVTPDGETVFVENNPAGQFMFVQQLVPELDILGAVAALLIDPPPIGRGGLPNPLTQEQDGHVVHA